MRQIVPVALIASVFIVLFWFASEQMHPKIIPGGLYSARASETEFGIVKVLAHGDRITHVRLYSNTYKTRPESVDRQSLYLASIDEKKDRPGIGHIPVGDDVFLSWAPVLLQITELTEEELEGYKAWKEAKGGAFGDIKKQ